MNVEVQMSKVEALRKIPYLAVLGRDNPLLKKLASAIIERGYEKGEIIFLEGEVCHDIFYLLKGKTRIFKSGAGGKEQTLQIIEPLTAFNEVPMLDNGVTPASAEALETSIVWVLPSEVVLPLLEAEPTVARAIMSSMAARVRHLTNLIGDISLKQVTARVAGLLLSQLEEKDILGVGISNLVVSQMTQQQMAAMTGTVREMVGRALRTLQKAGAIEARRGRIIIKDATKLQTFL